MKSNVLGTKNSHMFFPEFMIKAFYRHGVIRYLDADSNVIREAESSKIFNIQKGYYTDLNEKILNEEAEQKFCNLSRLLIKWERGGRRKENRPKIDTNIIYNFFVYQLYRDPTHCGSILDTLYKRGIPGVEKNQPVQEFQNIFIGAEKEILKIGETLKESFYPIIELNSSTTGFIAINVPIMKEFNDGKIYLLAVAPNLAYFLVDKQIASSLNISQTLKYAVRDDGIESVTRTNEYIMAHAIAFEPHLVLGDNPEYLKQIRETVGIKMEAHP